MGSAPLFALILNPATKTAPELVVVPPLQPKLPLLLGPHGRPLAVQTTAVRIASGRSQRTASSDRTDGAWGHRYHYCGRKQG